MLRRRIVNGHRETWPLSSKGGGFANWLRHKFYEATQGAPNSQALTTALSTLAAKARYRGGVHEVFVRIAALEDRVYFDLGDDNWTVIEIDAQGWRPVHEPGVRFLRRRGMLRCQCRSPTIPPRAQARLRQALQRLRERRQ